MDSNQNNITFIERNNRAEDESTNLKSKLPKVNPYLAFFLNRRNQLMIFVWIFALTVPILCYFFLFHQQLPIITSIETCSVNSTFRVKCGNLNLTDSKARGNCVSLSCCFDDFTRECFHSLPSRYFYTKDKANLEQSPFLTALDRNVYVFYNEGSDHVNIRLSNDQNDAFNSNQKEKNLMYTIEKDSNKLEINVKRINSQKLLLTSSLGPLISTQNYMEITFYLGQHLFGLDQLYFNSNETYNKIIYHNGDDHTTIPGFIAYQEGKFHGFLIDYDGPLEISVLPSRLIILRAIGKRRINFTLHVGPTPEDIAKFFYKQNNYQVPEKWVLGPHICRSGSKNVEDAQQFYDEFQEKSAIYNLRYESDCFDENLYFMMINETLSETNLTLNEETKFIMTIFPHIPKLSTLFDISSENDLFYAKNETESQNGTYFDLDVYYPDYTHENIAVLINELKGQFDIVHGFSFSNNWGSDDSVIPIETSNEFVYAHEVSTKKK
nr:sucrase-isomaltase, intestinal-like [Onthophagus taurus]